MSTVVNSITGAQPNSVGSGAHGLESTSGHEFGGLMTQASLGVESVFGSTTDECAASGAGSIHPSSDDAIYLGFRSGGTAGAVSRVLSDNRSKPCSS